MKNRWIPVILLATLLFGTPSCDQEPSASKGSSSKPRIITSGSLEPLFPISDQMTCMLLPRWLGQPGDWEHLAAMISKEQGARTYLLLCLSSAELEGRYEVVTNKNVSWTLMKEGFEQQIKGNPEDTWLKNTYAAYAWLRKDQAAGKRAFQLVNNTAHPDVWDTEAGFLDVKRWAEK